MGWARGCFPVYGNAVQCRCHGALRTEAETETVMSGRLIAPELETFPNRYRWTVDACYRLKELGFLEGRFELIDGEAVNKMGQNPPHFFAIGRIAHWANAVFGDEF